MEERKAAQLSKIVCGNCQCGVSIFVFEFDNNFERLPMEE